MSVIVGKMNDVRSKENDTNFGIVGWLPPDIDHVADVMQEVVKCRHVDKAASLSSVYSSAGTIP